MSVSNTREERRESAHQSGVSHELPNRGSLFNPYDRAVRDERSAHPTAATLHNQRSMAPVPDEIASALHHEPVEKVRVAELQPHDCDGTEFRQLPAEAQTRETDPDLDLVSQLMKIETTDRRNWIHQMVSIISAKSWQYL